MQIVICDDDMAFCEKIEDCVGLYAKEKQIDMKIDVFYRAESLIRKMENGFSFDAIFLDIMFPEMNGVETGRKIRALLYELPIEIVYISGRTDYCMDLFEVEPMNFHIKPIHRRDIERDLDKIVRRHYANSMYICYYDEMTRKTVWLRDVQYISTENRRLIVYTNDRQKISIKGSLNEFYKRYQSEQLVRCHRSYLVNFAYVSRYFKNTLIG